MSWREDAKRKAATKAASHIRDGFIVGLGSGTTVALALQEIAKRIAEEELHILGVPTSHQTYYSALKHHIPLTTLDEHPQLDITIDGADQVSRDLNMIKGMGGALTREKIVASASKKTIIAIDETKLAEKLGANQPIPLEVVPFALPTVTAKLQSLDSKPVLREAERKLGPVITDSGNFILDTYFGPIDSPKDLNRTLKLIPGIVETGLFVEIANVVYVGGRNVVRKLESQLVS